MIHNAYIKTYPFLDGKARALWSPFSAKINHFLTWTHSMGHQIGLGKISGIIIVHWEFPHCWRCLNIAKTRKKGGTYGLSSWDTSWEKMLTPAESLVGKGLKCFRGFPLLSNIVLESSAIRSTVWGPTVSSTNFHFYIWQLGICF